MLQKIKENLDNYLGFNSDELFIDELVRVFGGAIRDTIAKMPIKDIDILCGPASCRRLEDILKNNGYRHLPSVLSSYEIGQVYTIKGVINEPRTYIKDDSMVQLIRPVSSVPKKEDNKLQYLQEAFVDLIANVDISACGISWDGKVLYENYPNAILHATEKVFTVNNKATMYVENRIIHRTGKLIERGWSEIKNNLEDKRDIKIIELFSSIKFNYTKEYYPLNRYSTYVTSFYKELPF